MGVVIAEGPEQLGGHEATSNVPDDYEGPCKVTEHGEVIAVLPTKTEAYRAASYAIKPDGGYCDVMIDIAHEDEITHSGWEDWAFGC